MRAVLLAASLALASPVAPAAAQPQPAPTSVADRYAPYEFLIGEWTSRPGGADGPVIRQTFRWGPRRSYIFYSTAIQPPGKPETLHFEGMMLWNGATRSLDYLFALEPGSGAQEQGTVRAEADGAIVREVTLVAATGSKSQFRQTFRRLGSNRVVTSLMRKSAGGWEPTFPGSDALLMLPARP